MVNSPITELAAAIDETQTTIEVIDGTKLPDAPNLAIIGFGEDAETILYTEKTGNILSGVTRGFQGVAKAWGQGARIARFFTEYDQRAMMQNIQENADNLAAHLNENVLLGDTPHGWVYEEGAFTPYLQPLLGNFANIEYSEQVGYYVRNGNVVWAYGHLSVNGTTLDVGTASGHLRIAGLPYVSKGGIPYSHFSIPRSFRWNTDDRTLSIVGRTFPGTAIIGLYKQLRPNDNIQIEQEHITVAHLRQSNDTFINILSFSFQYLI